MSDRILATFRVEPEKWQAFKGKAKAEGSNASAVLIQFVTTYLDGNVDSNLDIDHGLDEKIDNAIAKLRIELTETIDNRLNEQSERFSAQIEQLKLPYEPKEQLEGEEQGKSLVSLASIFEGMGSLAVEVVPTEVQASDPIAVSKEEKKVIEKIKKELKAIGYTFAVWRQTGYGVWLIWNDRSERYKSAKIRLYRGQETWDLKRLNSENSWVPVSENNQVAKAIAPMLVELRNLAE